MTLNAPTRDGDGLSRVASTTLWIALVAVLSIGGSYAYACIAPLAAIAALAATRMDRDAGLALVIVAWLANQIVGFGLLDYPHTASTYAWGAAIGLATLSGFAAARIAGRTKAPSLVTLGIALLASVVAYEAVLYATGLLLGASDDAFSAQVVGQVFLVNAGAFAGLQIVHRAATALTWLRPAVTPAPVAG